MRVSEAIVTSHLLHAFVAMTLAACATDDKTSLRVRALKLQAVTLER